MYAHVAEAATFTLETDGDSPLMTQHAKCGRGNQWEGLLDGTEDDGRESMVEHCSVLGHKWLSTSLATHRYRLIMIPFRPAFMAAPSSPTPFTPTTPPATNIIKSHRPGRHLCWSSPHFHALHNGIAFFIRSSLPSLTGRHRYSRTLYWWRATMEWCANPRGESIVTLDYGLKVYSLHQHGTRSTTANRRKPGIRSMNLPTPVPEVAPEKGSRGRKGIASIALGGVFKPSIVSSDGSMEKTNEKMKRRKDGVRERSLEEDS